MKTVTAAVIRNEGRILLARRSPGSTLGGKWEFPGGKIEGNETAEDCLSRELLEELSITVRIGNRLCSSEFVYDHGSFRIEAFWVEIVAGQLVPSVHDRIDWVPAGDLRRYDLLPADLPIADAVVEFCSRAPALKESESRP
jgi:8-oxo-dGTP diphosphatase